MSWKASFAVELVEYLHFRKPVPINYWIIEVSVCLQGENISYRLPDLAGED